MKSRFRAAVFWAHLVVGVVAAVFVLNMAVSGICLAYEQRVTRWTERSLLTVTVPPGAARLDLETLIARAQEARPEAHFFRVVHSADPAATVGFFDTGENSTVLYLNPYTGNVVGDGRQGVRRFFHWMTGWHRWLAMEGENKPTGKAITGAISLAFFGLLLSGLFLWLPKKWSRKTLGQIALFRGGLRGKARDWNWHNVVGIWCAPLILILTLTGILMSYSWAKGLLYRASGESPPVQSVQPPRPKPNVTEAKPAAVAPPRRLNPVGLNPLVAVAESKMSGWKTIGIVLPYSATAPVSFFLNGGEGDSRPDMTAQLVLERRSGAVIKWEPFASHLMGEKIRAWVTPVHTGEVGGLLGQTLAVLGACGAVVLVWTGLALAWRRSFGGSQNSRAVVPTAAPAGLLAENPLEGSPLR